MEETYIDVNRVQEQYERTLKRFQDDATINPRSKELVLTFLRDAALGKTVLGRAKKKIGRARLTGYINQLYPLIVFVKKDLDKVTQEDMEWFIEALDADQITSRSPRTWGSTIQRSGSALSTRYKTDIKITVKKFYKWLLGESKVYPSLVEWIDTVIEAKEIPALTEAEVSYLLDCATSPLQRVLIQLLFDGGFRIGELLNIRLHHVRLLAYDPQNDSKRCFVVRVPFSKTLRRTVALPMAASTKWLKLWLERHPARPRVNADGTLDAAEPASPLIPLTGNAVRLILRRAGQRALKKRVYPHLMRHTSATYWSNKLPYFKFCKRFGWTMTSKMPQRYIDREGVDELGVATLYEQDELRKLEHENRQLADALTGLRTASDQR